MESLGPILSLTDKITSFGLVIVILVMGSRGTWVWGATHKRELDERDERIRRLEEKLGAQERLIDRLSGIADRSTDLGRQIVTERVRERGA